MKVKADSAASEHYSKKIAEGLDEFFSGVRPDSVEELCDAIMTMTEMHRVETAKMFVLLENGKAIPSRERYAHNILDGMCQIMIAGMAKTMQHRNTFWGDDELVIDQYKGHVRAMLNGITAVAINTE